MNAFEEITAAYIAEKRAVGYKMEKAGKVMARIAALHADMGCRCDELPRDLVEAWVAKRPGEAETTRFHRMGYIRGLGEYMARMGYDAYVLPGKQGYTERGSYSPHIFTDAELCALFASADRLAGPDRACQRAQAAIVMRLLCSSGLRVGEACGLCKGDVDLDAGVLTIRHAKNDKDRVVPMHAAMASRMRAFAQAAQLEHPQYGDHELFWSLPEGRPLNTRFVYGFFRDALWGAGISHGGRGKGPRVHDLRFTFACHRLRGWVEAGDDVNALMPYLATYMGHADMRCTEYYLRLTAELFPGMVARVERECGWMVPS